jgi:hypothetical protein
MDMEPETQIDVESRIARAQSQEMAIEVVSDSPLVVEVSNETSGRIHTVLPETVHCSCEDHTYRESLCKHLIFVADGTDYIAEELRQSMTDDLMAMQSEAQELRSRLREIESKQAQYNTVRESLDTVLQYSDPDTDRTEDESEATDTALEPDATEASEPEEHSEFRRMVSEISDE